MKQFLLFFIVLLLILNEVQSQTIGYKLTQSPNIIYAYRDSGGKPDLSIGNRWSHNYWFKVDDTEKGKFTDPTTSQEYIRITIISDQRYDDTQKKWVKGYAYGTTVQWVQDEKIDGSDFNNWLWIKKSDFSNLKIDYSFKYRPIKINFLLSGLTVPFKYRPAIKNDSSSYNSLINGDINIGSFIGARFARSEKLGLSVGGHFGVTSISLNAANNTSLTGDNTEVIQGFSYGYGAIADVNKKIQIGFIVGYDFGLGKLAKTYVYQQKPWLSFSLNYKFIDSELFSPTDKSNEKAAKENKK